MRADHSIEDYYKKIQSLLTADHSGQALYQAIVDAPFKDKLHTTSLDLGIVVLLLVNPKTKTIDRIAYSHTDPGNNAVNASPVPFKNIKIPLDDTTNISAKAIRTNKPQHTTDWFFMFTPVLTAQAARFNQAESGMDCSFTYPLDTPNRGGIIFSFYQPLDAIGPEHHTFMKRYTQIVSQALQAT